MPNSAILSKDPIRVPSTLIRVFVTLIFLFCVWPATGAKAESATLTWDAPTTVSDIYGYKVYYGQVSHHAAGFSDYEYSEFVGNVTTYRVEGLEEGIIYYFAVTTMDISGNESTYSDEVCCTISTGNGNKPPRAVFNTDTQAGTVPLVVNFDASGSHDADGGIVRYSWRFGDGETGEGIYASHTYVQPGQYTSQLTVTDTDDATDTTGVVITVRDPFAPQEIIVDDATDTTGVVITVRDPFAPQEIIVDNGEVGTSSTGRWRVSGGADPYGDSSLYSKKAGATYTFEAAVDGAYEVSLWWTKWPSRSTSVPVEIYDGNTLLNTVVVNQQENASQWNVLGTYTFSGTAGVTVVSEDRSHSTCADAVRFVFADSVSPQTDTDGAKDTTALVITVRDMSGQSEIIVDNGEVGTSSTGRWQTSGGPDPYGDRSLYSRTAGATYTFETAISGAYEVSIWWTEWPSRSRNVPVEIYDGNTLIDTVTVNQYENGGQWNVLGTYTFSGTAGVTVVSEDRSHSTCADAVRFLSADTL